MAPVLAAAVIGFAASPSTVLADVVPVDSEPAVPPPTTPYVSVQVGVELQSLESAAWEVAASVDNLAVSMQTMTASPSLSEEQKAELMAVMERVDLLSERVTAAVEQLPEAVEGSRAPLTGIASDLAHEVRRTVVLALGAVVVVVVLALLAMYFFTIRPTGQALSALVGRLAGLAKSVEDSVNLVAETNAVQLELARILEAQREAIDGYTAKLDQVGAEAPLD
ncbi:MAG: hypothetical protein KDA24_28365 [Deltaproteobacteria bacterium]|nr:hypothetical protein [Deltaproteobacteria bacterium]